MEETNKRGQIFVISGPSGVGKGTLLTMLLEKHPEISLSVSVTTRKPRCGETDGVNYFFTTKENFQELVEKEELLEWAEFAGNYYGTYVKTVEKALEQGNDLALEIDVQGALQVKHKIKDAVLIFISPPSLEELESRLIGRNTETREAIEKRLSIVRSELEKRNEFNYEIINDNLDSALNKLEEIIIAERSKRKNNAGR